MCETLPQTNIQTNKQASMPTDSSGMGPQWFFLHHLDRLLESPGWMTGAAAGVCYDMDMNVSQRLIWKNLVPGW